MAVGTDVACRAVKAVGSEGADLAYSEAPSVSLPTDARLPINRCNFPALILGGLTFQRSPDRLELDGVRQLYGRLFDQYLAGIHRPELRAQRFMDYVDVAFRLYMLRDAGWDPAGPKKRIKANYLQLIRGWGADANGQEAAVLKGWVESRFGLRARFHRESLEDGNAYAAYMSAWARGLYATNAIESQLDLLYTYCQHELHLDGDTDDRLILYRGVDRIDEKNIVARLDRRRVIWLLNNLSSFSSERERAEEFGYYVLTAAVPRSKVLFHDRLLPRMLTGEGEYMVIGGLYEVTLSLF